ncbi:hypothetical protein P2T68_27145 [Pseudomonas sp. G11]|uniref:hypothetical protein n=1 Tax=Pseudomonas sp. G11 TaxID=528343 RepID=UPI002402A5AE|nr:hypothetical protein [Pseudomonas sp. G11]WEX14261.1 hypothetical protein P2T68_27145 [Pseudomonas sp. G11]
MIHINRDAALPSIAVYNKATVGPKEAKKTRAARELEDAIKHFTDPENYLNNEKLCRSSFGFNVYKDKALKGALHDVFGNKCAYCDSYFGHVTPKDIEHFRPKSEVDTPTLDKLQPGYYWLAGDWHNLLVSCPDCNRGREHQLPGQSELLKRGKHTQFPLQDERERVRHHGRNILDEEPYRLLLNPCIDQPEIHFTYDEEALIFPRVQGDARAETSIVVYALQRGGLVKDRKRVLNDLTLKLQLLSLLSVEMARAVNKKNADDISEKQNQLRILILSIGMMFKRDAPYLGMVRDCLRRQLESGELDDVVRARIDLQQLLSI